MKEEAERQSRRRGKHLEVNRGAPAAAVCGEDSGQHNDVQGRARGDLKATRRCRLLFLVKKVRQIINNKDKRASKSGERRAGRVMGNPWRRRRTLWLGSSLLLCLVAGEFVVLFTEPSFYEL